MTRSVFLFPFAALFFLLAGHSASPSQAPPRVIQVFVALADNQHQGIVPVPARLGDGEDPSGNLYWGAAFGVKTFFRRSANWRLVSCARGPKTAILERCVFRHRTGAVYLIADAYRGSQIRTAVTDFLLASAGLDPETLSLGPDTSGTPLMVGGAADLVAYVGHDAFMDFQVPPILGNKRQRSRAAIILACGSKVYFAPYMKDAGAYPLLWTTGLMAPEAYTLKAALDGWIAREDGRAIRELAAEAYSKYQKCGLLGAQKLFSTGW